MTNISLACKKCSCEKVLSKGGRLYCRNCTNAYNKLHKDKRRLQLLELNRRWRKNKKPELYSVWSNMKDRCSNSNSKSYKDYGGRGIRVCERWLKFENFSDDMGKRPSAEYTLERLDSDGNYEPGNCVWIKKQEQSLNRRMSISYKLKLPESITIEYLDNPTTLKNISEITGIDLRVVKYRYVDALRLGLVDVARYITDRLIPHRSHLFKGVFYSVPELSILSGLKPNLIWMRLCKYKWSVEKALELSE